jgi:PAS domain S-box-containing protein
MDQFKSHKLHWALFRHAPIPIALVDTDGKFIDVNEKWCHLTGYSKTELLAKSFMEITNPSDIMGDTLDVQSILKEHTQNSGQYIKSYIKKDGTLVQFELIYNTINDPTTGSIVGFVSWALPLESKKLTRCLNTGNKLLMVIIILQIITMIGAILL